MLVINPLIAFFPDYLSFLIYGLVTGYLLRFWSIAKRHFITIILYLTPCVVWLVIMWAFITVQPQERQVWFLFGVVVSFIKIFSISRVFFGYIAELITERIQEARQGKKEQKRRDQKEQANQNQNYQSFTEEQARREAEAKAYRAGKTGKEQDKSGNNKNSHQSDHEKIEDKKQPPPADIKTNDPPRSYEQILGLSKGWTQDDLKTAYKRECQRTHPDKWTGKTESLKQIMEAEYKAVQEAYKKLKK